MKPRCHSRNSVKRWKGTIEDYQKIHEFLDSSKAHHADLRHRALFHSSFGCYIAEQIFGHTIKNSSGIHVSVRDVAELHILEDLGRIPCVSDYLNHMQMQTWFGGPAKRNAAKKKVSPL